MNIKGTYPLFHRTAHIKQPLAIRKGQHREQAQASKDKLMSWLERLNSPHLDGVKARAVE